jgi:phosphoglucomutase/phosphomannomutase
MSEPTNSIDVNQYLKQVQSACDAEKLTSSAVENIKCWLTEDRYAAYVPQIVEHIESEKWQKLDDAFWTVIPFGTGGRRGKMYPFGSNSINERTIGESAQGLADYVKEVKPNGPWKFAIAYDTRHRSREFSELCASIMVANGFEVYFIDDYRSTPELSYLIRYKECDCGIMVTASHNPPSDNAVKVYWSNGAQLIPPHDKAVIAKVAHVDQIPKVDFQQAVADGKVHMVREETDAALMQEHLKVSFDGPRDLKVIFSPLHGVGEFNVKSLLETVGFNDLEIYGPHREPSGDFPNVPGHVSNPERAVVFEAIIAHAKTTGAELILASDPDCDRMGAAAPLTLDPAGPWKTFNGNQLAAMLAEFVISQHQLAGNLTPDKYIVSTLVTSRMLRRICQSFDVKCFDENLVGFKWICNVMDEKGPENFLYGSEESHGYLVGQYCRDKDGAIACLLMCELAALVKSKGISLHQHLEQLYQKYGFHSERLVNIAMQGSDGMKKMKSLMELFRTAPPESLGGLKVVSTIDYSSGKRNFADGTSEAIEGPTGDLILFETEVEGNYVAARPSGTEPKIKFYMFTYMPGEDSADIPACEVAMNKRLDGFAADMEKFAESV